MARKRYSDGYRALVLAALTANGGNLTRTARQMGVPPVTLRYWRDDPGRAAPSGLRRQRSGELTALVEVMVCELLAVVGRGVSGLSALDAMIAAGICVDKWLALRAAARVDAAAGAPPIPDVAPDLEAAGVVRGMLRKAFSASDTGRPGVGADPCPDSRPAVARSPRRADHTPQGGERRTGAA